MHPISYSTPLGLGSRCSASARRGPRISAHVTREQGRTLSTQQLSDPAAPAISAAVAQGQSEIDQQPLYFRCRPPTQGQRVCDKLRVSTHDPCCVRVRHGLDPPFSDRVPRLDDGVVVWPRSTAYGTVAASLSCATAPVLRTAYPYSVPAPDVHHALTAGFSAV